jgi:hypothetical protein
METKYRIFGQAVSKSMIVSVCVMFWRHSTPRWKGYFITISMVIFVLKGGEYALRYLRYKNGIVKSSKCRLSIKSSNSPCWKMVYSPGDRYNAKYWKLDFESVKRTHFFLILFVIKVFSTTENKPSVNITYSYMRNVS